MLLTAVVVLLGPLAGAQATPYAIFPIWPSAGIAGAAPLPPSTAPAPSKHERKLAQPTMLFNPLSVREMLEYILRAGANGER